MTSTISRELAWLLAELPIRRIAGTGQQVSYAYGRWDGRSLQEWTRDVVDDVIAAFDPARLIVFGSVARGEDQAGSDLDLLVLFDEVDAEDRIGLMGRIRGAIGAPIPVDVLVASVAELTADALSPSAPRLDKLRSHIFV